MDATMWILVCSISTAVLLSPVTAVCPYDDTACTCSGATLLCSNLTRLPTLVSNNRDGSITNLTFQFGNLQSITDQSLPGSLETLIFSQVSITSISAGAFSGSSTSLRSFSMNQVNFQELPDALLKVNGLTNVILTDVNVVNWKAGVLQHLANTASSVAFVNVGLKSWPDWLRDFTLVNSVDLSSNALTSVPSDAFTNANSLTRLVLSSTSLNDANNLNVSLTPVLNTLEYLDISNNKIHTIPSILANMPELSSFLAANNTISEISSDRIPPQLIVLDLSLNKLQRLTDTSFPTSSAIQRLLFTFNPIDNISDLAFQPLTQVTFLSLSTTYLTGIPVALTSLPNLKVLVMNNILTLACSCPPDARLVSWFQSLKRITIYGTCGLGTLEIASCFDPSDHTAPSSGIDHLVDNRLISLLLGIFMAIYRL